jgi:hypothetical protein
MENGRVKEKWALALSVAIIAGFWTWITMFPTVGFWIPSYVVFLTWASGFLSGGGFSGFKTSLTMNITGAVWAYVGILLAGALSFLGAYALPAAIFIVCLPLCLMAIWRTFELTPAGFIGAASLFAVFNSVTLNPIGVHQVFLSTVVAIVLGNLTLFVCEYLINTFVKAFSGAKQYD